jgi:hypothetical protein
MKNTTLPGFKWNRKNVPGAKIILENVVCETSKCCIKTTKQQTLTGTSNMGST